MKNLSLIGMPGSGKSTVGVLLAKAIAFDFLDTDLLIQRNEGKHLQDLVDSLGVQGFLDVEEAAISSLSCHETVISPGGSVVCREKMITHLKTLGPVIYLHVPFEELQRRIQNLSTRGIAMEKEQSLAEVLQERAPLYDKYADATLTVKTGQSPEDLVRALMSLLRAYH
ncbi:MAG: shikimate kinase [Eubacteriales bacterium]